jgi:ankyrin repeat protein
MHLPALVVSAFAAGFAGIDEPEPLHAAARTGNIAQAHFALLRSPDAVNRREKADCWCRSPVHIAAESNRVGVLKLLLARGGAVDGPGEAGFTPLQSATVCGSTAAAELLLRRCSGTGPPSTSSRPSR